MPNLPDDTLVFDRQGRGVDLDALVQAQVTLVNRGVPAGVYAPSTPITNTASLVDSFTYFGRFVAPRDMVIVSATFGLVLAAVANDNCGVGIYTAAGVRIGTSGAVAGKLNGTAGPQTVTLSATPLVAGNAYYAGFTSGAQGGAAAVVCCAGPLVANASSSLAGITQGTIEMAIVAGTVPPATMVGIIGWGYSVAMYLGE